MKNIFSWLIAAIATIIALGCTYYTEFTGIVLGVIWCVWLIIFLLCLYLTAQGKQFIEFANESRMELLKVIWPTRQETIQITSIVMIMVAVTGLLLWCIDSGMMWIIGKITHLG